jgi:hypothetical protein
MRAQITAVLGGCQLILYGHKLESGTTHEKLLFLMEKASEPMLRMVSFLWSVRWACGQDLITAIMERMAWHSSMKFERGVL